ncbi:hypothetical protein BH23BAC1_BH23BAC1_49540 [soil metagenome]
MNSYQPLSGAQAGMGSFLRNLFAPKEGGTVVGNQIRSTGTLISGGSATVVQPQTTVPQQQVPYQQPVVVAPQSSSNNNLLIIGAGVAVLAAVGLLSGKKGS